MDKSEKLILLGKSGSGKSYLLNRLKELGLKPDIKLTTRNPREGEIDGVHYNFVSRETFLNIVENGKMKLWEEFTVTPIDSEPKTVYYGISEESFKDSQIFIMTPGEYKKLDPKGDFRNGLFVVYLDIDRDVRESRLSQRNDGGDSISRRLDSDDEDFRYFNDYDLKLSDPLFEAEDILDMMN
jgi:guanylate kinase